MKIDGVNIRINDVLEYKDKLWSVVKTQHTQPGKGGAYMQVEMKDIISGTKLNERFRSNDKVEKVRLDQIDYQFLYEEGDMLNFMDQTSYEQISLPKELLGERLSFLQNEMVVSIEFHEDTPLGVTLPTQVILEVMETEPVVKGQTAASSNKPAIMDNGVRIMVPPFINVGDKLVVNTEESSYIERAK